MEEMSDDDDAASSEYKGDQEPYTPTPAPKKRKRDEELSPHVGSQSTSPPQSKPERQVSSRRVHPTRNNNAEGAKYQGVGKGRPGGKQKA
jgi:hypothetical protein